MTAYFCLWVPHSKPGGHLVTMRGVFDRVLIITRDRYLGVLESKDKTLDELFEMTSGNVAQLEDISKGGDLCYCLSFVDIQPLGSPFIIGEADANGEGHTTIKVPPKGWIYADKGGSMLVSLNDSQMAKAMAEGKTAVFSIAMPAGEIAWGDKTRLA